VIGYSVPSFIIAILFLWLVAVNPDIFPVSGRSSVGKDYTGFRAFVDKMYHFALPLIVMTFCSLGGMTRYVRSATSDTLSEDFVRTAKAKGLAPKKVIITHAFKNALLPICALVVGWIVSVFSGSIMIENVFGINGVGKVYFEALSTGDNEIALALQIFYIFLALFGNLITDLIYGLVDPRIKVGE
jgi:peptide/nickel transport system permease protein